MATPTYPVGAHRIQGETLALSTAAAYLGIPPDYHQAIIYVPLTAFRLHLNPAIKAVRFYDASASSGARWLDEWRNTTDRDTATGTGSDMNSMTTSDFLYMCFEEPTGGVRVTIGNANANASTMTATYRKNDDTWASVTITDGTISGGAALGQTGNVTWTVPTDWKRATLGGGNGVVDAAPNIHAELDTPGTDGHWIRFALSAAADSTTSITELASINRDTSRGYFNAGTEYNLSFDLRKTGAIEAILASGTDTMNITWIRVN